VLPVDSSERPTTRVKLKLCGAAAVEWMSRDMKNEGEEKPAVAVMRQARLETGPVHGQLYKEPGLQEEAQAQTEAAESHQGKSEGTHIQMCWP